MHYVKVGRQEVVLVNIKQIKQVLVSQGANPMLSRLGKLKGPIIASIVAGLT